MKTKNILFGLLTLTLFTFTSCGENNSESISNSEPIVDSSESETSTILPSESVSEQHSHNWNEAHKTEATCVENGVITYVCIDCEEVKSIVYQDALGHKYEDVVTNPTCEEQGYTTHTCNRCNDSYKDSYTEATGHSYGEWTTVTIPSCETEGLKRKECANCEHYEDEVVEALGHIFNNSQYHYDSTGHWYECDRCDERKDYEEHTPNIEAATETDDVVCLKCNYVIEEALGHIHHMKHVSKVEATCENKGNIEYYQCEECSKYYEDENGLNEIKDSKTLVINPLGHNYKDVVTNPTCTEQGYTTHTCSRCNDSYVDSYTSSLGHKEVIDESIEPTCTNVGWTQGSHCDVCKEILVAQKMLDMIDHNYIDNVCSECGKEEYENKESLEYELSNDGTYYIVVGIGTVIETDIVIPETYKGLPVKEIGDEAFADCVSLINITIPETIKSIGNGAFSWCESLTNITIPDSVIIIGEEAFSCCELLTSVIIGNNVTIIGEEAFADCDLLASVIIGNNVIIIGDDAFEDCESLTTIEIPNSVTSIGEYAFMGCSSLTSITIPSSVTSIGVAAFSECDLLENIVVDSNNKYYDSRNNCNAIIETSTNTLIQGCNNTIIPYGVTSIGENAFAFCNSITSIEIPDSVTYIGEYAFGCSSLESITIPSSVTTIGNSVFSECSLLTNIYYLGTEEQWNNISIGEWNYFEEVTINFTEEEIKEELAYELSSDESYYIVTGIGTITDTDIVIPESYKGLPVKKNR